MNPGWPGFGAVVATGLTLPFVFVASSGVADGLDKGVTPGHAGSMADAKYGCCDAGRATGPMKPGWPGRGAGAEAPRLSRWLALDDDAGRDEEVDEDDDGRDAGA
jgi:hypothetical protein